jgi:anti-anti-sigma factor
VGLIQPGEFRAIRQVRTMEFRWACIAALGVLFFGTLQGIVIAIIVSLIGLASQSATPRVYALGRKRGADVLRPLSPQHPDDETFGEMLIVRTEGRMFFANATQLGEALLALLTQHQPKILVLDLSRVPDIEYSALKALQESDRKFAEHGVTLWLAGCNPGVLEVVRNSGLAQQLGPQRLLFNARTAIENFQQSPQPQIG